MNNQSKELGNYDIIGDIHGYAHELKQLLLAMDYQLNDKGCYSHTSRTAIFVGDFIDRGTQQKAVINIVRPMVDSGAALAVMGNHEFNAISFHSMHPKSGQPLRDHNANKTKQHQAFLDEYTDKKDIQDVINWFKTLPIFLELDEIRIIHACWNTDAIDTIKHELDVNNCIDDAFIVKANEKGTIQFDAIETLLKGLEMDLPDGINFKDSYGKTRSRIRVKWWQSESTNYKNIAIVPKKDLQAVPDIKAPIKILGDYKYNKTNNPVFCGHYWMLGQAIAQQSNVACVDYSVAKGGNLTAYRWNHGDKEIYNESFFQL